MTDLKKTLSCSDPELQNENCKDERSQFWDNVLSDDSDGDAGIGDKVEGEGREEEEDDEVWGYDDPQLDLDSNGENGALFHSIDPLKEAEELMNRRVGNDVRAPGVKEYSSDDEEDPYSVGVHEDDIEEEERDCPNRTDKLYISDSNEITNVDYGEGAGGYVDVEGSSKADDEYGDEVGGEEKDEQEQQESREVSVGHPMQDSGVDEVADIGDIRQDSDISQEENIGSTSGVHGERIYKLPTDSADDKSEMKSAYYQLVTAEEEDEEWGNSGQQERSEIIGLGRKEEACEDCAGGDSIGEELVVSNKVKLEMALTEEGGEEEEEVNVENDKKNNSGEWEAQNYDYQGYDGQGDLVFDLDSDSEDERDEGVDDDVEGDVSRTSSGTLVQADKEGEEGDGTSMCSHLASVDITAVSEAPQYQPPSQSESSIYAAYSTPGRVRAPLIHVDTVHSTRGFCVDLDSESGSDIDVDGVLDKAEDGEEDESTLKGSVDKDLEGAADIDCMDFDIDVDATVVPDSERTPPRLSYPRSVSKSQTGLHANTQRRSMLSTSSCVSTPSATLSVLMSPMSASTVNSSYTSSSLSSHAVRSLALSRLNLVTESNMKALTTQNTNRIPTEVDLAGVRTFASKIVPHSPDTKWFEGSAFSPPPSSLAFESYSNCKNLSFESADKYGDKERNKRHNNSAFNDRSITEENRENKEEEDEDELSEEGTLEIDKSEKEKVPNIAHNRETKIVANKAEDDDYDDDVKWTPCSRKKNMNTVILDDISDSESDSDYKADLDSGSGSYSKGSCTRKNHLSQQGGKENGRGRSGVQEREWGKRGAPSPYMVGGVMHLELHDSDDDVEGEKGGSGEEEDEEDESIITSDEGEEEEENKEENEEFEMNFDDINIKSPSSRCKNVSFSQFRSVDIICPLPLDCNEVENDNPNLCGKEGEGKKRDFRRPIPIDRPISSVTDKKKKIYNNKISDAKENEKLGNYENSFKLYVEALEICDEDTALHGKLAYISQELEYFS